MADQQLDLTSSMTPEGVCAIQATGVLDAHTSGELEKLITSVLERGCHKIACDINGITYIASAGVGVFIGNLNTCQDKGGNLVLVYSKGFGADGQAGIQEGYNVLEVFNLLGLAEHMPVAKSWDEAKAKLG